VVESWSHHLESLENKFTNQGYKIWECEKNSKKVNAQFAETYYNPTKECWQDWVALQECMNCNKVLCGVHDEDGQEEIYLYFDKEFQRHRYHLHDQ
jgi:hypothetical protein